jgi:tetratricopeptide (TPR) repeat protein
VPDPSRIEELQRRVKKDPASIAFAQLAEEYRRQGQLQEAVDICLTGLARHPGYLSARVTLGRSLMALGDFCQAEKELAEVLRMAPENLTAIRTLVEIRERAGGTGGSPGRRDESPVPPGLEQGFEDPVRQSSRTFDRPPAPGQSATTGLSGPNPDCHLSGPTAGPARGAFRPPPPRQEASAPDERTVKLLGILEEWLEAILRRGRRRRS